MTDTDPQSFPVFLLIAVHFGGASTPATLPAGLLEASGLEWDCLVVSPCLGRSKDEGGVGTEMTFPHS